MTQNRILNGKQIAIIGGGPGGLTLARLLQLKGAIVRVYERDTDKNVRVQGATLDLHEESGLAALEKAGLTPEFYAAHRPGAGRLRIMDKEANIHLDDHENERAIAEERPEIDRGPLRKLLLDALHPETVMWDRHFISMSTEKEGWKLMFKNGTTAYADLVIAADGAHSKIRKYITAIPPVYSGVTIIEGNIYNAAKNAPKLWKLVKGGKIFAFGNAQSLILSAKGDGSLSFYTGCKVNEIWSEESDIDFGNKAQVQRWFQSEFDDWDIVWQELFAGDDSWFFPRPQYHFPMDQNWTSLPNLTMLGDAAHRMPPYAGEGVNMAMLDALELANCLSNDQFDNVMAAINHYETNMQKRSAEVTRFTLENTDLLHGKNSLEAMLAIMKGE